MALGLTAWLEDEVATQLQLGNSWLKDHIQRKQDGSISQPDEHWDKLYEDSGSCLNIINEIHPDNHSNLQIFKEFPLTLTDGGAYIEAKLAHDCFSELYQRYHGKRTFQAPSRAVLAVRKYTIQYTSYGPPRDQLQLVLNKVDWQGDTNSDGFTGLRALISSDKIRTITQQLHHTRALSDRQCFGVKAQDEDTMSQTMDGVHDAGGEDSSPNTQTAFGTQPAHLFRSRQAADDVQILGVNRMEPVLAGNTQREELRLDRNTTTVSPASLLNLIHQREQPITQRSVAPSTGGLARRADMLQPKPTVKSNAIQPSSVSEEAQTIRPARNDDPISLASQTESRIPKRVLGPEVATDESQELSHPASGVQTSHAPHDDSDNYVFEPDWMSGFHFTRETGRILHDQQSLLLKPESWQKPEPGYRFPDGNIPIKQLIILSRVADEGMVNDVSSQADSDQELDMDPSPASDHEDDIMEEASSQFSWSSSLSPEPLCKRPTRIDQGLPPDSSFEARNDATECHTGQGRTQPAQEPQSPVAIGSSEEGPRFQPPSSPPVERADDSDEEMEVAMPHGLGEDMWRTLQPQPKTQATFDSSSASPNPVVQVQETPYAKSKHPTSTLQNSSRACKDTSSTPVVYGTGLEVGSSASDEHHIGEEHSAPLQRTGRHDGQEHRQHQKMQPSDEQRHVRFPSTEHRDVAMNNSRSNMAQEDSLSSHDEAQSPSPVVLNQETHDVRTDQSPIPAQSHQTPRIRLQEAPLQRNEPSVHNATHTKRKLDNSPSMQSTRLSKRREIKLVPFDFGPPPEKDLTAALRQEKKESLQKFKQERQSGIRKPIPSKTIDKDCPIQHIVASRDAASDACAGAQSAFEHSPRNYDPYQGSPPNHRSPTMFSEPQDDLSVQFSLDTLKEPQEYHKSQDSSALTSPSVECMDVDGESSNDKSRIDMLPEVESPWSEPLAHPLPKLDRQSPIIRTQRPPDSSSSPVPTRKASTVFQRFKEAYPQYTGDIQHFIGQCKKIYELELADKMVAKWQWDDYIIRNRTDYKNYAMECMDRGEDAEPYFRFYKNHIRDTIHKKGIIESSEMVLNALQELDVQLPTLSTKGAPQRPEPNHRPSRQSLPWDITKQKAHTKSRNSSVHDRQLHSFGPGSYREPSTPNLSRTSHSRFPAPATSTTVYHKPSIFSGRSTSTSHFSIVRSRSGETSISRNHEAVESTGDPFRDFIFAQQRMMSHTGSSKVDPKSSQWPQNLTVRPIAEVKGRKVDVLSWKDQL